MCWREQTKSFGKRHFEICDGLRRQILKRAKPADLPVERPTKIEFLVNSKTAKQLGLTIPPEMLPWADKVIK
jgi:putative tryptophan/tyrosine transport system substrate-binding protein